MELFLYYKYCAICEKRGRALNAGDIWTPTESDSEVLIRQAIRVMFTLDDITAACDRFTNGTVTTWTKKIFGDILPVVSSDRLKVILKEEHALKEELCAYPWEMEAHTYWRTNGKKSRSISPLQHLINNIKDAPEDLIEKAGLTKEFLKEVLNRITELQAGLSIELK